MTNKELINFIKNFNMSKPFELSKVISVAKNLNPQDHQLLVMLVNYKNKTDFANKLKKGEI